MTLAKVRLGYFADGPWSHRALDKLLADEAIEIAFICARFDNPDPILRQIAAMHNIPFCIHQNINSDDFHSLVENLECDLFVSMSFNQIFRQRMISLPPKKTINCHAGKLPFYRGRNVLNWVLINDEREFGITVHYVDEGIDTGDIILQEVYQISNSDDYGTLLKRAYAGCADILYQAIQGIRDGCSARIPQTSIHPTGFYCSGRCPGDERLEWNATSREIFNFVRAICHPGPQARTFNGDIEVKINKVELIPDVPTYSGIPGAVLQKENGTFLVKSADSFVRVVDWSSEATIKVGDRLK